jgi:hypothetical protein
MELCARRHMHVTHSMRVRSGELQSTYQISKGNHFSWRGLIQVVLSLTVHCRQDMHPETCTLYVCHAMVYSSSSLEQASSGSRQLHA